VKNWFQNVLFKCVQLVPLQVGRVEHPGIIKMHYYGKSPQPYMVGAVQLESHLTHGLKPPGFNP
jgi:hypothetical protein